MSSRTAIILVHGVGDEPQRSTLQTVLSTLEKVGQTTQNKQQILREPGTADKNFSYFLAEPTIAGQQYTIAECHWADLSQIRTGFGAAYRNFYHLASNAPYLIYACLGPDVSGDKKRDPFILRCLRALQAFTIWLIYYPIIALNVGFAFLVTGFAIHSKYSAIFFDKPLPVNDPSEFTYAITSACAILLLAAALYFQRPGHIRVVIKIVIALLSVALVISLFSLIGGASPILFHQSIAMLGTVFNYLWASVIIGTLIYFLSLPLLMAAYRKRWRGLLLGFTVNFLVVCFWLLLIMTLWLILLTTIFDKESYQDFVPQIEKSIGFVSLFWFDISILSIFMVLAGAIYLKKSRANKDRVTGQVYPRLIVPTTIPMISLALFGLSFYVMYNCSCTAMGKNCSGTDCPLLTEASTIIIWNAVILLAIGGFFIKFATVPIEVASDIINFFKSENGHRQPNPLKAISSVFRRSDGGPNDLRFNLKARLIALIEDLNDKFGPFNRLAIVSHSLGSIVAIDTLVQLKESGNTSGNWTLVTMGSPYNSIFRYYFPQLFKPAGPELLLDSSRWTNIYRENDYVGTRMTDGNVSIQEIAQPPLGHTGYFSDTEVLQHVFALLSDDISQTAVD